MTYKKYTILFFLYCIHIDGYFGKQLRPSDNVTFHLRISTVCKNENKTDFRDREASYACL